MQPGERVEWEEGGFGADQGKEGKEKEEKEEKEGEGGRWEGIREERRDGCV